MAIPGNYLSLTTEAVDPGTSGWTAKSNAVLVLGSGGRNGDGVLALRSVAAGEAQARTVSQYPVNVGETYEAFADAAGATVPERIGIQWLNASAAEISITWSPTTATTSASWHRIAVAGVAPIGTVTARVILSTVTPAAAGVTNYFENVYLGLPQRFPKNLLSINAEQMLVDAGAWSVEANGTLSRTVPPLAWPVDWYYSGGPMLTLTVTAAGNASVLCTERATVQPGVEYLAFALLNLPSGSTTMWSELRFYNVAGAQLQATRSTMTPPGTGAYRQIASDVAPAGAVTASVALGITGATVAQVCRFDSVVLKERTAGLTSTLPNTNVVLFGDTEFEQGIGAWTVSSGVATIARSTPWGAQSSINNYSLTVTSSTATASVLRSGRYPVTPGVNWRLGGSLKRVAGSWSLTIGVRWYNSSSTLISTTTSVSAALPSDGQWWTLQDDQAAPAGAATGQLEFTLTATAATSTVQLDTAFLRQVLPQNDITADDTTGSVDIVLRELTPGSPITLYRVTANGARSLVRGSDGLIDQTAVTSDQFHVEDYEAPLGVPVYYQAEIRSMTTGKVTNYRTTATVTLDAGSPLLVWLKDVIEPHRNIRLVARDPLPTLTRDIEQGEHRVLGRRNSVILTGIRAGATGEVGVFTRTADEKAGLDWLLDPGHVVFIQASPASGWRDLYAAIGSVPDTPDPDPASGWDEWTLPLTEVDRPTGGQSGSADRLWNDIRVENATWGDVLRKYGSWLDVLLNRPRDGG
ncbi:hypothetical protein [Streptomyces sp. NPDC010273]|uniref:hypothetical protein n=1 Tax=Streptomyces sp. NPDC010273 TaxID=3364829 RepID=UPI0036EEEC28